MLIFMYLKKIYIYTVDVKTFYFKILFLHNSIFPWYYTKLYLMVRLWCDRVLLWYQVGVAACWYANGECGAFRINNDFENLTTSELGEKLTSK